MNQKLFISDLHFSHKNIIRYDNRPYFTVTEMNKDLITKWNNKVDDTDIVYILGDISWDTPQNTIEIFKQLKGSKIVIKGNHDSAVILRKMQRENCIDYFSDYDKTVVLDNHNQQQTIIMSHWFIPFWDRQFQNSIHLYGHVHNSHQWNMAESWIEEARQLQAIPMEAYNVGCMMPWINFEPKTHEEIKEGYQQWKTKQPSIITTHKHDIKE